MGPTRSVAATPVQNRSNRTSWCDAPQPKSITRASFAHRTRVPCVSPFSQAQEDLEPAWVTNNDPYLHTGPTRQFLIVANRMARLVNSEPFEQLVLVCIVMAGVLVGVQTYEWLTDDPVVLMLDAIVLWIFVVECAAKILACGLSPLQYFVGPSVHATPPPAPRTAAPPHPYTHTQPLHRRQ